MATGIGPIEIQMLADLARLRQDMNSAKGIVTGAADGMGKAFGALKGALGALGVGLSAGAIGAWVKDAINAADETSKLAQKMGVTTKEVAGLQLAFEQSGSDAQQMQTSIARLSKEMANGNAAFERMGINVRDAQGNLRGTREVLGEVADKFQTYEDGAAKAALAQELFGKAGADLIPLLNAGAEGLEEMDRMAEQLGLTIDENTAASAERFNDTLDLIGKGTTGIGRQIAAQLLPTLEGLAGQFLKTMTEGDKLKNIAAGIGSALKAMYVVGLTVVELFKTLGKSIGATAAAFAAVIRGDFKGALTILQELKTDIGTGWTQTLDQAKKAWDTTGDAAIGAMVETQKQAAPTQAATARLSDSTKALAAEQKKAAEAAAKHAEEQRKLSVIITNVGEDESAAETARLKRYADRAKAHADMAQKTIDGEWAIAEAQNVILTNDLERWREAQTEKERIEKERADAMVAEQAKVWDQIAQSMTDSLMDGGKNVAQMLKDLFRTVVLRPVLAPMGAALSGAMAPGTANAGSLSGSLLSGIGAFGGAAGAGLSNVLSGNVLGAFSAAGSLIGTGSLAGITSGLGMGLGALAPGLALLAALPKLKSTLFGGEIKDSWVAGGFANGETLADAFDWQSGGLLGSSKQKDKPIGALGDALTAGGRAMFAQVAEYARILQLPAEAVRAASTSFEFGTKGLTPEQIEAKAREVISAYGNAMAAQFTTVLAPLQKAGETLVDTMARLAQTETVTRELGKLGGIFAGIANSSLTAKQGLVDLMGGIEQLAAAAQSFVSNYYSEAEQAGIGARGVMDALAAAGIDASTLTTKAEYRALLESLDPETQTRQLAALLQQADAFAKLADYMAGTETQESLGMLAAGASEQLVALQTLTDTQTVGLETVAASVDGSAERIERAIADLQTSMAAAQTAIATYTQRTAVALERVLPDGDALAVRVTT
jgi:hypothetical protein